MARKQSYREDAVAIPPDAKPHKSWPPLMLEMAAHIGAYDTLRVVDAFAGRQVYVSADPQCNPFVDVISPEKCVIISHVYRRERLEIPTGRNALLRARRQGVIAAIHAGKLTVLEGAAMLRMSRRHLSRLVNHTAEGTDAEPVPVLVRPRDDRQMEMFAEI